MNELLEEFALLLQLLLGLHVVCLFFTYVLVDADKIKPRDIELIQSMSIWIFIFYTLSVISYVLAHTRWVP